MMVHDIFVPCRVGNYYLHTKRVLSVEITPVMVQGLLIEYSGSVIDIKNTVTVFLKDSSSQTQIAAIKKIVSTVGAVDEVVSTLATSAIIFKEMELPFLGRDTLKMVIPFEVEAVLPFALDEAVIDFLITKEDTQKKVSTVLIAAVRKTDIDAQFELYTKAEVDLQVLMIDVFALYRLYQSAIFESIPVQAAVTETAAAETVPVEIKSEKIEDQEPVDQKQKTVKSQALVVIATLVKWPQQLYDMVLKKSPKEAEPHSASQLHNFTPKRSEVLVDIGWSSIKVLYLKDGMLHAVRIIPFGASESMGKMSEELAVPVQEMVQATVSGQHMEIDATEKQEYKIIFDEISRTLQYFEKQEGAYFLKPHQITFAGFYSNQALFASQAKEFFGSIISIASISDILKKLKIKKSSPESIGSQQMKLLAANLWNHTDSESNLLQQAALKNSSHVLHLQLLVMFVASIICIGTIWLRSSSELSKWQTSYNGSKKQFTQMIQQQMNIDLKNEKNLQKIVETAEETLKRERNLWFSFMKQNEASTLEYLQDLSVAIDRSAIGLELSRMHIDYEKITISGTVKSLDLIDLFNEELQELKLLDVVEKPRTLSWNIQLQPKDRQKGSV